MGTEFQFNKMKGIMEMDGGDHIINVFNTTGLYT